MRILFLTTIIPIHQRMGSEVASQCFIDGLRHNGHQVSIVGYMRSDDTFEPGLQDVVVGKRYIETKNAGKYRSAVWFILSLWLNLPYSAAKYYSRDYLNAVKNRLAAAQYDLIIIDHPQLGWLKSLIPDADRLVTIAHNIEHEIYLGNAETAQRWIDRWVYGREARLIKRLEDELATTVREVWALTEQDSKYFTRIAGVKRARVFDLPPRLAEPAALSLPKEFDIGLIGNWAWKPSEEGLQWFLQQVYPHLPQSISIHVAGRGAEWLINQYANVNYHGFVPDAQEFMAKARVMAVPTLSGGGIQIKTLDAIAAGAVIVATPVALRGVSDLPTTVQAVEQPDQFAAQLLAQMRSPQLSAQEATEQSLNWYSIRQSKFLDEIADAINLFKNA